MAALLDLTVQLEPVLGFPSEASSDQEEQPEKYRMAVSQQAGLWDSAQ